MICRIMLHSFAFLPCIFVSMFHVPLVIEVFSYVAETERNKIKERQQQGIELAKEKGVYKGRPFKYTENAKGADKLVYEKVIAMLQSNFPIATIAREVNLPRKTVYAIRDREYQKNL